MADSLTDEQRANKRYLVQWKLALNLSLKGANQTVHGKLSDIAASGATALVEHNLPAKAAVTVMFVMPPKTNGESPQTIQVSGKLIYCVLGGNGLFRTGIQFDSFAGQGQLLLEKELSSRIPLRGIQ